MDIIREDCIYARQSVDRKDSISIESQIDFAVTRGHGDKLQILIVRYVVHKLGVALCG